MIPGGTFLGDFVARKVGQRLWVQQEPFGYVALSGKEYTVREGAVTDLGSSPRILWPLVPPDDDQFIQGFVLHDDLYQRNLEPRAVADALLYEMATLLNAPTWRAFAVWAGVRIGGGHAYRTGPERRMAMIAHLRATGEW